MTAAAYIGLIFVLTIATPLLINGQDSAPPGCRPGLVVDCAMNIVEPVWLAGDDGLCKTFSNRCFYNNHNCWRYRNGKPLLKEITKEQCQQICPQDCSQAEQSSFCGSYGNNYCKFSSRCEVEKNICKTGNYWLLVDPQSLCDTQGSGSVCPS